MKVTKLLQRATSLFLVLAMLFSFPVGAYSEGTGSDPEEAPEIPEGYVWRTLSVELAPFEEDKLEKEEDEAARVAEKVEEAGRFMELMLSHATAVDEEADEASEPVITVRGWMPEDVTARAELIPYSDADLYAELALMQAELRFYDFAGQSWTPVVPVTVFVDGAAVRDARTAKMDPTVYVYEEEPLPEKPEERLFSVEAFSDARTDGLEKTYEAELENIHADITEQQLAKDDEYPDAVCFEAASESLRFAVTARQQERYYSASAEDGKTEIVVVGTLPRSLSAAVAPLSASTDGLKLPGSVVCGWDLSLTHPEQADYQIDGSVKVALHDPALADVENEDWELQLWQLSGNEAPARVKSAVFRGEDLRFSADALSSYVVVRVAVEHCLTATDGESYAVRVSYDSNAGIPASAELDVQEIRPGDGAYAKYMVQGIECTKQTLADLDFIKLLDITLRDPETGVTYQPNQNVKVSIELLSDSVADCSEVKVVHFGEKTEVMGSSVNGDAVAFETSGFSVYVVMGVSLEKTVTASDGNTYEISVTYAKDAGIPTDAELVVRELIGVDYEEYLSKTAEFLARDEEQLVYSRFFDITLEKDGVVYEPNKAVSVSIKLIGRPETQGELRVVHFADEGTELLENELTADGAVKFATESFSVYAITDEDGTVKTVRAFYKFYCDDGTPVSENATQIIRNQGKLIQVNDHGLHHDNGKIFGNFWYVKNVLVDDEPVEGTWGDEVSFNTPISVTAGDKAAAYGNTVVVPTSQKDSTGEYVNHVTVEVYPYYTSDYAILRFVDPTKNSGWDEFVAIRNTDENGEMVYEIPDVTNSAYTVEANSSHPSWTFKGWSQTKPSNNNYYNTNDNRAVIDNETVKLKLKAVPNPDKNPYYLYPVFGEGNWVIFNTAPLGAGATYVKPVFVKKDKAISSDQIPDDPIWRGYGFEHWTTTPTFDKETGTVYSFETGNEPPEFNFNTKVNSVVGSGEKLQLYAYWKPGYSTYTVIYWKQRVTDDRDAAPEQRTYEFDSQETRSALTGDTVELKPEDKQKQFTGFHHKEDVAENDPHKDSEATTVVSSGSTVLNVYYDRNIIRIKFYKDKYHDVDYDDSHYTDPPEPEYVGATDDEGSQYGLIDGKYVVLKKNEQKVYSNKWTFTNSYNYSYTIANNSNQYTDGKFYLLQNGNYNYSGYSTSNPYPQDDTRTYYCYESYWTRGYYVLTRVVKSTNVTWYYEDANGNEVVYNGGRYKLNSNWFWYTGLYGQNLSKYGYTWPDDMFEYFAAPDQSETGVIGLSFLGQFVLPTDAKNPESNELRMRYRGTPNCAVKFYLQRADMDGDGFLDTADDVGHLYIDPRYYSNFSFSDKYDGYTVVAYQRTYHDSKPDPNQWNTNVYSGDEYGSVQLTSQYDLHIRYGLRSYSISYFDASDGTALTTKISDENGTMLRKKDGVLYGANISQYYPAADFTPASKTPGLNFNGRWYSDQEMTKQIFFGEKDDAKLHYYFDLVSGEKIYTGYVVDDAEKAYYAGKREYHEDPCEEMTDGMPNRNIAVYAGFSYSYYWIKIDPNKGALTGEDDVTYERKQYGDTLHQLADPVRYVQDKKNGTYYYHYDEFDMEHPDGIQPESRKAEYVPVTGEDGTPTDPSVSTDGEKKYRIPDPDSTTEGYVFSGWYKVDENAAAGKKYTLFNFNEQITENLTIQAMWREKGSFYVYYSKDHAVDLNGNEVDNLTLSGWVPEYDTENGYADGSPIVVKSSGVRASDPDDPDKEYEFVGWYFNNEVAAANGILTANRYLAEQNPESTDPRAPYDTFILYPVFRTATYGSTSSEESSLILDANGGHRTHGYTLESTIAKYYPEDAVEENQTQVHFTKQLLLNMDVTLPIQLPGTQGNMDVFQKDKAEFLGWAFNPSAKTPAFYAKQIVGVDNDSGSGYDGTGNILYAVWRRIEVSVKIRLRDKNSGDAIPGGTFTLRDANGDVVTGLEGSLVSNSDGFLAKGDTVVFNLPTPSIPGEEYVYNLTETLAASGYVELDPDTTLIVVDYLGNVTFGTSEEELSDALYQSADDAYLITLEEVPAVCKILDGAKEHLFVNLIDAVAYIDEKMADQTGTIEMIRDFGMTDDELVTISYPDNVTLSTASTDSGVHNPYLGSGSTARIYRTASCDSLFTVDGAKLALNNIILDGNDYACFTDGGLVCVDKEGVLNVEDDTQLINSRDNANGGAIYLGSGASANVTNCTIKSNYAVNGAGIYVSPDATLTISGNIDFGGNGLDGENLSTTAGNFSTVTLSDETNATLAYTHARQDVYLTETGVNPTTLYVSGALTGGDGTIWVYAENPNHFAMNCDFAVWTGSAALTDDTMHAFRNAREDSETGCSTKYLTGEQGSKDNWIAWTGGVNVSFRKVDGFGEALSGAGFTLYTAVTCDEDHYYEVNRLPVKAQSGDDGVVTFEMLPAGIYYMMETLLPDTETKKYEFNKNVYVLLVGREFMTVPTEGGEIGPEWSKALAGTLSGIQQSEIDAQRETYTEIFNNEAVYGDKYYRAVTNYAIFQLDTHDHAHYVTNPNIARSGILNVSTIKRAVILSKINPLLQPLTGGKFTLRNIEGEEIRNDAWNSDDWNSDESGVFFAGLLPLGTYLLEETAAPSNPRNSSEHYSLPTHYYVFQVTESGVMGFKQTDSGYVFALTNTITEATTDEYLIHTESTPAPTPTEP